MPEKIAPSSGKGDFVGWTGCGPITLYLENVLGFRPDGVRNRLTWQLRLKEAHGVRRLRFGQVKADLLYDGAGSVSIQTDKPFTLVLKGVSHAIPAGPSRLAVEAP